ncbi:DNA cytosine methyltransferase [Candidatus Magnetomonas plexicatena]|uniref:DNA cytosine methyltransferase n=1 Tax=Candidatus Magnetomonas plexicatena TaxID=2552947 RepID=UPI001101C0B0|nr:DNA cytosine methyltransferase [Nitrospirales bacterium LBB_01]
MDFRFGELFSGPGGLALGAKSAKVIAGGRSFFISHVWSTDYDKDTCTTYRHNICPDNPKSVICCDIRKLDFETLKKISEIDALAFGFPCNDFSVVGEQKGMNGVYGPLYSYGVKALKHFQPKFFMAENVGGLRNANDGNSFDKILNDLQEAGYVITPHLYKFEQYGVPQARHRIIIIGIRNDINIKFYVPATTHRSPITCREAIETPPISQDVPNNELTRQSQQVIDRLKFIKPGENAFTAFLPKDLRLNVKGAKISQIYKRLDPDKPAYTITGSGGGGTHVYHWKENRALTNRERARLQTFPDNYVFYGSKESVRKQIGMAVPSLGVRIIFEAVLKSFAGIEYSKIENNIKKSICSNRIDTSPIVLFEEQPEYAIC